MNRITKYDILRVIACFSIVLLHVSASYWSVVDVHSKEFLIMTIYNSLTRFAVPVFFMLSGLFLVSPQKENLAIGKRILKLLVLFYVWSAFYAFQGVAIDALHGAVTKEVWAASVQRFIFGHTHMWFIQILIGFYILIPIARQICAKKDVLQYYLILWTVFKFLLPCLTDIFHLDTIQARIDSLGLDILVGNFGYFLLGYYLNVTDIKRKTRWIIYAMGIAAVAATAWLTVRDSIGTAAYVERWFSPASLNILIMSAAIFICFKYGKVFNKVKRVSIWQKLSGYTFFIYMFHMFVIEKLNLIGITTISFPAIISVPILTIFTFTVSLFGAFAVDRIPFVRKIAMLH
ncbi:Surface polysaccharide O-acyltransferase, integral membrane enzyme [Lachnospiraceae bacterium NLAE-zl-G231]|nr:Surface polysaccharide O-acyltransferase, integral membrane enzyme [Lachnospiraceae bacterium NLAE-zl-G231]